MERFLKFILLPLILTASLPGLGFCYSIINSPENATVLAGSDARFNCTVSVGWLILIWLFNGNPVLTVINPQGAIETSDRFTSRNYTSSNGFTSELIIHNTQLSDSGKIECSTQQPNESSFAFLSVQENDYIEDSRSTWVIVLAVVLSVVGIVLLIIIIAVVVRCCCLKKKGSTYENEIRKVSAEKKKDGNLGNRQRHGSENQGYIPEELWNTEEDPRIYSLLPRYPKFTVRAEDLHTSSASKVQPQRPTDYPINPKKIRNMTLV
ncbi:immunoglobulin superfamily member 5 isoform X4 [Columba livia]|uniref:immunoglobulin superfamily member 5 isoform X4 n=1 Tax=Columba livia TaxID=8932 RepID=UPI000398F319|nr:immunoglobulin superfamily member 5 isoform X3 [Columba livia]PKK32877.1 immunoglobulin superfamily, member 5, transcript variant X2 [Columba livia]